MCAYLCIIDSGYVNINKLGTAETLKANSGTAITLKSVDLNYQRGQGVDNSPITATEQNSTINPVSVTNPVITLNGVLKRTNATDMAKILLLDTLTRSKGVKLLYYNSTAADISAGGSDGWSNVISTLGYDNVNGNTNQDGSTVDDKHTVSGGELYNSGSPIPHLHVMITQLRISQGSDREMLNFTLTCEVTNNADTT